MRRTAGYIWTDYKTNVQIAKELKITPILDKLLEYLVFLTLKKEETLSDISKFGRGVVEAFAFLGI